jgi:ribosomal protein S18 acetylase RimI-like enzyme
MHISITTHDELPEGDIATVGDGLDRSNAEAAPLDQVKELACFARTADGGLVGGAVGRTWGACCELQQLWVHPEYRGSGVATRLVRAFEQAARSRGCETVYLFTYSFQAPALYRALGYVIAHTIGGYPAGIERHTMMRRL